MKLSKFPYVVQKEIFDNMKTTNLFWLSFASKNMKTLIKSSQTKRFKSISRVTYNNWVNKWYVCILFKTKNMRTMEDCMGMDTIMAMSEHLDGTKHIFQLNVSGKKIGFRVSDEYPLPKASFYPSVPEAFFHPNLKESAFKAIHNYISDFFGDTVVYLWTANSYKHFIPQLPNLSLWVTMWPDRSEVTENIETFFASYPDIKYLSIRWDKLQSISPESQFYEAESIRITRPSLPAVHTFSRNFKGRQATLSYCECGFVELIEFMGRWRSGKALQKLEYLKITLTSGARHVREALRANWVKHIAATEKPPTHSVPDLYTSSFKPNTDPITSHSYIVRETDNRVASVSVQGRTFSFGVWNKTEEEFLKMVEQSQISN
ncbi:hypothetical protein B9Z55_009165 [Caenorhabditis nigoni]|uniref:F-box domain-containing protein n=2 Tax=Caenorhabditis nigoni TaxID=1611254 RepID=A0A2G5UQW8_9PELO|nr:hypothetical protein B9Z55_009165 [Caenorhabditis nigoni]